MSFLRRSFARSMAILAFSFTAVCTPAAASSGDVEIVRSSQRELVLRYTPELTGFDSVKADGQWMYIPRIAGTLLKNRQPGAPSEFIFPVNITVPSPQGFRIVSVEAKGVKRFLKELAPVAFRGGAEMSSQLYRKNPDLYRGKSSPWSTAEYKGVARTRHLAALQIAASRYDAVSGAIEIPASVTVHISFDAVANSSTAFKTLSKEDFKTTINHDETAVWQINARQESVVKAYGRGSSGLSVSSGNWYKLAVESEGIYKLDAAALAAAGINLTAADIPTIKIFGNGGKELSEKVSDGINNNLNEQPIIVRTKADGNLDAIIFYASDTRGFDYDKEDFRHFINHYTVKNSYLLTWGGSNGRRAVAQEIPSGAATHTPSHFTSRIFHEEELVNPYTLPSGRRWFGEMVNDALPLTFTTQLPGLVRQGDILYRVNVAQRAKTNGTFTISEGNTNIFRVALTGFADSYLDATSSGPQEAAFKAQQIPGDNRSALKFAYTGTAGSTGYVDWFEIHYPRELTSHNGELELFGNKNTTGITEYTINGFSGEILGFDVTDRANPVFLKNSATTGGMFGIKEDSVVAPRRYFIASSFKNPQIQKFDLEDLRGQKFNTDVILITHEDFLTSANNYKKYRESKGELSVVVITTKSIFAAYSYGAPDPTALRDFLAQAYHNADKKPRYVLFWGDGHYDYRNIATKRTNFIPTYESQDADGVWKSTDTYSTEDYFARIVGDDEVADLALGRLPISSDSEGEWMKEKISLYEQNSSKDIWRSTVTLVADDGPTSNPDPDGSLHNDQSERLSKQHIPADILQNKIYMVEFPKDNSPGGRRKPRVTDQLLNAVNTSGTLLLNWIGHGNPRLWAHEAIFEKESTIPLMTNLDKLFFLTAATCDFGRFDQSENQSGAEDLVLSRKGGAIGVFSASRVVFSLENAEINQLFYKQLFSAKNERQYCIGDAYYAVKQVMHADNDEKFFLLGDPTLQLLAPRQTVQIESINGQSAANDTVSLKALAAVTLSGRIIKADSSLDDSFNGTVIVNMFDSDINLDVIEAETEDRFSIQKTGGALTKGAFKVINGKFTASFVIPKDISFVGLPGRLYSYALSDDDRFAKGATRSFKVNGIDSVTSVDYYGPKIDLYVDGKTFKAGNLVRKSPVIIAEISDETGINTTGAGVGHNIEMWLDDNLRSENVTPLFSTSFEDARIGKVEKQVFNLSPGRHSVRLRAWDVFNNYSEQETYFVVAESDEKMIASDVSSAPNPFSDKTCFSFQHNQSAEFSAGIRIFTTSGDMVRSLDFSVGTSHTGEVCWDGRDDAGNSVAGGMYVYSVTMTAENGTRQEKTGNIIFIR